MLNLHDALTYPRSRFQGDRLPSRDGWLLFQDTGARVLAVAHLDWVGEPVRNPKRLHSFQPYRHSPYYDFKRELVQYPALDDRLGVWALHFLRDCGLRFDLLLTDNEEYGMSTARDFLPPRQYDWMFSLDRAGTDCVLYQYEDAPKWADACEGHFEDIGLGSYSCIAELGHLGCPGFNLGIGYYDHNGPYCWADLAETRVQMAKLIAFHQQWAGIPFEWDPAWEPRYLTFEPEGLGLDELGWKDEFEDWGTCELCGAIEWINPDMLCEDCAKYWLECYTAFDDAKAR